jgi:hypothetical protein
MSSPKTIPQLIDAFGGPSDFAKIIGKNPSTASEMKRSGAIRVSYWPHIVEKAAEFGVEGVTLETIAEMHLASHAESPA